jgi:hypothetical protein
MIKNANLFALLHTDGDRIPNFIQISSACQFSKGNQDRKESAEHPISLNGEQQMWL